MAIDPGQRLMTVNEVAEILKYSAQTVHTLIKKGELTALRIGREYRIQPGDFNRFLENRRLTVAAAS